MARPKSEDKKQALLEAATAAFAQSGIAASTALIARNAGVAEGTLFRYFATKDDLLNALYLGLPRSWWEGSERHIQLSVVEHHPQFKALPVSVSPGFYPQQPDLAVKCLRISV